MPGAGQAAARTSLPTFILGESGTGGAFTGAQKTVKGKFELVHDGTLFIDEIADLSLAAQAKILRAVEYGEFERLGGEKLQVADVRLVSATHLPLARYMNSDRFRTDLFHRICGIRLTLPPLREPPEDLRALVATEVALASRQQGKSIVRLSGQAVDALLSYHWPGNLRDLKRVIHAAVAMTPEGVVPPEAIMLDGAGARRIGSRRGPGLRSAAPPPRTASASSAVNALACSLGRSWAWIFLTLLAHGCEMA